MRIKQIVKFVLPVLVAGGGCLLVERSSGLITWLLVGVVATSLVLLARAIGEAILQVGGFRFRLGTLNRVALGVGSVFLTLFAFEGYLQFDAWRHDKLPTAWGAGDVPLTMPKEWEKRVVNVPGSPLAYYWQGKLHVHNQDMMRRVGDFPAKQEGTFRIMVVGDSLTYGYGVAAEDCYSSLLESSLRKDYAVEVLNLGVSGMQSEDILRTIRKFVPKLKPDLVVYGMCLNDFLPSGIGEYHDRGYRPFNYPFKEHICKETRCGRLLTKKYDDLLMNLGLRVDFFDDILQDFGNYQTRFARDVHQANEFVVAQGLPPVVTMVLHQFPAVGNKAWEIMLRAEEHLNRSGMTVISAEPYIKANVGKQWHVSPWEGHPNEAAHQAFAAEFERVVRTMPVLECYRKDPVQVGSAAP